ncbi:MAG: NADH-quinone oxidoreductase subunit J family protein [Actinomycetota bacterium]
MVAQNIAFGVLAFAIIVAALKVVTTSNIVHAALWLVAVLAGIAANFILLAAEFVAAAQVLVYIGAIVVLFLFGIMLTRAPMGKAPDLNSDQWPVAVIVALTLAGTLGYVLIDAFGDEELPERLQGGTGEVGDAIFSTFLIPFEVVSVLLLAALIGAIVLARRD